MDALRIVALCVAAAALSAVIRMHRPEMAMALSLAVGVTVLAMVMGRLGDAVSAFSQVAEKAGLASDAARLVLRVAGIACLGEFGAQLCRDAGEGALAGRIEMGGRVVLLGMSAPLIVNLLARLMEMMP